MFCPLVLNRTGRVHRLEHLISLDEIRAVTRFVTKTPDDDRRMVEITPQHPGIPYEMRMFVCRVLCKGKILVSHAMRLYVRFIDNI